MKKIAFNSFRTAIILIVTYLSYNDVVAQSPYIDGPALKCLTNNIGLYHFVGVADVEFKEWWFQSGAPPYTTNGVITQEELISTDVIFNEVGLYVLTATYKEYIDPVNLPAQYVERHVTLQIEVIAAANTPAYNVSGGGSICLNDPNSTTTVTLSGSQPGVTYSLVAPGGVLYDPKTQTGNAPITWTDVRQLGEIYVVANDGICKKTMNGHADVTTTSYSTPTVFEMDGGGTYCQGDEAYVTVLRTEAMMTYTLMKCTSATDSSTCVVTSINGGGNSAHKPLILGPVTTDGIYRVRARYTGSGACGPIVDVYMDGAATITFNTPPGAYTLTGHNFCSGSTTGSVTTSGSHSGVEYQLLRDGIPWGDPVDGTGSGLEWVGLTEGRYAMTATDTTTSCFNTFGNVVLEDLKPEAFIVSGDKTICGSGTATIDLDHSEVNVVYELFKNESTANQLLKTGLVGGGALHWTGITAPGTYTVVAKSGFQLTCTQVMDGKAIVGSGPVVEINVSKYICTNYFSSTVTKLGNCGLTSFLWNFGDGATSTEAEPFHDYSSHGNYTITLQATSTCDNGLTSCTYTATKPVTIGPYLFELQDVGVKTDRRDRIINTTASTFGDAWQLPYENSNLSNKNPYVSGERGVWRNNGQFAYKAAREQSANLNLATDGTFSMDFFNWQQSEVEALPDWIKANSVTKYSAYSFELENKDVMDIYSSALYDHGGQLITAEGGNMRSDEMAFTSFEDVSGNTSGNWTIGTQQTQIYKTFKVINGSGHMATVAAPLSEFSGITDVDVFAYNVKPSTFFIKPFNTNIIKNDVIACSDDDPGDASQSVLVLKQAAYPGYWAGAVTIKIPVDPLVTATLDTEVHHTGARSLKITSTQTIPQHQFILDKDKKYFVTAWVSVNNINLATPNLGSGIGLQIIIKNNNGTVHTTVSPFTPSGPIIEGWQQVSGTFDVPIDGSKMDIKFMTGGATVWFDDLRLHPDNGVMKSYVYDLKDFRLVAMLDAQNFASLFYYDNEGNLIVTKKETERGIKTISENVTYLKEN